MDSFSEKLRVGDIITLEHAKPYEGWLSAEDVINSECILKTTDLVLEDCLWQVCVQHQYSSTAEYEIALLNDDNEKYDEKDVLPSTIEDEESPLKELNQTKSEQKKNQLQRAAITENKLNNKLMAMKYGKPVAFGDVIQLLHVKSQTYLTVSSTSLAKQERENLQVYFDPTGNTMSWLQFMPRFKYHREGQAITNDAETYIRVHESSSDFIHAARKFSKHALSSSKEINCSLETTCWKINIYQRARDTKTKNILLGHLVSLQEPEASTYLTLDLTKSGEKTSAPAVVMSSSMQLSFSSSDCNVGTNLLWMIEGEDMFHGGAVSNHGSNIALRDLNSGMYMKMGAEGVTAVNSRADCSFFELCTSQQTDIGANIVDGTLVQLSCQNEFVSLKKGTSGKLHCEGSTDRASALSMVITSKLQHALGVDLFTCVDAKKILTSLVNLLKMDKVETPLSVLLASVRDKMLCFDFLEEFMTPEQAMNLFEDSNDQTFNKALSKADVETSGAAAYVIRQTVMREQGVLDVLLDLVELTSQVYLQNATSSTSPQTTLRKRSANRGLMGLSTVRDRDDDEERGFAAAGSKFLGQNAHIPQYVEINEFCLRLLFLCISKNHSNQVHISDRLSVLLELVKDSSLAVTCVEELIRDNPQILQTKVRDREIKIFLKMLLESEFNSTLLKLLRSTCSCQFGVDSTQRMVSEALYSVRSESEHISINEQGVHDQRAILTWSLLSPMHGFSLLSKSYFNMTMPKPIVITVLPHYDARRRSQWSNIPMYLSCRESITDDVMGIELVRKGLPRIFVTWESIDYSAATLFNRSTNDIPIELINLSQDSKAKAGELLKDAKQSSTMSHRGIHRQASSRKLMKKKLTGRAPSRASRTASQQSQAEKAVMVSEYFVAQLYLAADLCLDRNYVSIGLLESSFPYAVLLSFLKIPTLDAKIKAPVCRMIRCLYVDREPQIAIKYPRLVKTTASCTGPDGFYSHSNSKEGRGKDNSDLNVAESVVSPDLYRFGVLQIVISEFLHNELDATRCDDLSTEMMNTLLVLLEFGFYDSGEQLQDIITPLVQALDDHFMNRGRGARGGNSSKKKSSIILLQEKVKNARTSLFDNGDKSKSIEGASANAATTESQASSRVNVNFRHTRSTLNAAMHISLSQQAKSGGKDSITDATRKSILASAALARNSMDSDVDNVPLELSILRTLESLPVLIIILTIVICATIFATVQILTDPGHNNTTYIFEMSISCIFFLELSLRSICYFAVHKELISFVSEPLNVVDILLVTFDICLISLDSTILSAADGATSYAKTLKTIRILRLIRVFRAARLLKRISERSNVVIQWQEPARYSQSTDNELRTIAGILKILSIIHLKIQDRKLSTSLQAFIEWSESDQVDGSNGEKCNPCEVYERLLAENNLLTNAFPKHFESNLLDIMMYSDQDLAQEALNLLLLHKSQGDLLFSNMKKMQIIYTDRMETKFSEITELLKKVSRLGEAFEIWAKLDTSQEIAVAEMTLEAIVTITSFVKVEIPLTTINLSSSLQVDAEVQLLLLNVNAIDTFMTLQFALLDASHCRERGDVKHPMVLRILRACNDLIGLFVYKSPANQMAAFKHFDWFLSNVDNGVNSSKVVRAILSGNRDLIKQCPHKHLAEFIQKIAVNGQRAEYLDLFVGLTDIEDTGDSSISLLRNEISRYVTNTERSSYMLLWCCPRRSKAYEARVRAMEPYVDLNVPPPDEDLTPDLQYHINLLQLLVGCKLGPKMQAIYPIDDVIVAILDPRTIFNVKRNLGLLLLETMESNIIGLECSEHVWLFVDDCIELFEEINDELALPRRTAAFTAMLGQRCEWMNICLSILTVFFQDFDFVVFNDDEVFSDDSITQISQRSEQDIRTVMNSIFTQVSILREKSGTTLNKVSLQIFDNCLACWEKLSDAAQADEGEYSQRLKKKTMTSGEINKNGKNEKCRRPSVVVEIQQIYYRKHFHDFVELIREAKSDIPVDIFPADIFERLPSIYDPANADLRLEPFVSKIATHFRNNISRTLSARVMDQRYLDSSVWMLQTLKTVLQKTSGVCRENMFNLTMNEQEVEYTYYHLVMNDYGIVYLCLDLIAVGIDSTLCAEAVDLLVMLLCKSNGRLQIQQNIEHYLSQTDSTLFFEKVKDLLEQLVLCCERNHATRSSKDAAQLQKMDNSPTELPHEASVLLLLSNMTADNFSPNKQLMHVQEGNGRFVNILDHMSNFLDILSRLEGPLCTKMSVRLTHSIISLLQGPNRAIQEHFVIRTEMLMALNRYMRSRPTQDIMTQDWSDDFLTLKENLVDLLRASIEGQTSNSVVVERLQTTIEISILNVLILPVEADEYGNTLGISALSRLQAKYLVFLQALADQSTDMPFNAIERMAEDTAFVEVMWEGVLTKHYFHIPETGKDLSENSKTKLTDEIEFSTQEKKLKDFVKKAKDLHREAEHQQLFKSFGIVHLWSWKTLIAKVMFINCLVMNAVMTAYFTANQNANPNYTNHFKDPILGFGYDFYEAGLTRGDEEDGRSLAYKPMPNTGSSATDVSLPLGVYDAVHTLNGIHIALSVLAYMIILVVQVPLLYSSCIDKGRYRATALLLALLNPVPLWYLVHTIISLEAFSRSPLILSLLLLQFVAVDSASNEVMLAVIYPFRQLVTTLVIVVIFIHIFASTIFVFFRHEFSHLECHSLWQSFKLMISYGFRSEEGIGRYMQDTIGIRIIVDVLFYFVIVVILRNIFFGVVIDTFGELRSEKVERQVDANSRCFICGVDQNEYDKKTTSHEDFKTHRNDTHNMWNYLYFIMRIWKQRPSQDTSLEKFVRQCLLDGNVSWFPVGVTGIEEKELADHIQPSDAKDVYKESSARMASATGVGVRDSNSVNGSAARESAMGRSSKQDIDCQLQQIQETLGKLSTVAQAKSRSTFLNEQQKKDGGSLSGTIDSATQSVIENIIRNEIAPISTALEEAMCDVHGLLQRLHAINESKRPSGKLITMSPKKNI